MNIRDDCYPLNDYMKLAGQVENIEKAGRCSENTAALIVLAEQMKYISRGILYISRGIDKLDYIVSRMEAEEEEHK